MMEDIAAKAEKLGEILARKSLRIAVAESCTGGLLGHIITNVPGASRYFLGGVVAYDNNVKIRVLNVSKRIIEEHGAVSEECAVALAVGVRKLLDSDISIGITGIAGPTGGTPLKPIGLVYMAISFDRIYSRKYNFSGDRIFIKHKSVLNAIEFLLEVISNADRN